MKKLLLTIITLTIIGLNNLLNAQAPNWAWAKSAGGTSDDRGYSVATDASGNVFMTGCFYSPTITFGTTTLANAGIADIFIVKYDASGNVLWTNSAGGSNYDWGISVCTDASGNVYITGAFKSPTISFGSTTLTNASAGINDIFIVKYDAAGNALWAKSAGNAGSDDVRSICTDTSGNVFITGQFRSFTITFGTTTLSNAGADDIFIVKYDSSGNVLWAENAGGTGWDESNSISTDPNGNVFITGNFTSDSITFGATTLTGAGLWRILIVKYDGSGNVLWAKSEGNTNTDYGYSVSTDGSGNVFMTGRFDSDSINFGNTTLLNEGSYDIFIAKYDASGNVLWAKSAGGTDADFGYSVCTDASGNVFLTGYFYSPTITFGTTILANSGNDDIFIVKYNAIGNVLWAESTGSINYDECYQVATNVSGNVFITGGFFSPTITFGTTTLTNSGTYDIFIAKLDNTTGLESTQNINGISIYPNPANDILTISTGQLAIGKAVTLSISDIAGKVIYYKTSTVTEKMDVNTKDFAAGVYLVQVQTTDFVETRKVIVEQP